MKREDFILIDDYDKQMYDVLLEDGTVVHQCWPNSDEFMSMDGSGRRWDVYTTPCKVSEIQHFYENIPDKAL